MVTADECSVRPVTPADEAALEAFVLQHPEHSPGHRRAFAILERAFEHRELSVIAESGGRIVGYAPAFLVHDRVLRSLRVGTVAGGSLVGCGPLVAADVPDKTRAAVLAALMDSVREATRSAGAHWLRYIFSPIAGDAEALTRHRPFPLLPLGFTLRTIPGPVADLRHAEHALFMALNATTRRRIRNAERQGLQTDVLEGAAAFEALLPFRHEARKAFGGNELADRGFDALGPMLDAGLSVPAVAHVIVVRLAGEPLSAVVTCESNGTTYYFLAFNSEAGLENHANRVALWQSMLAAKARGNRWFQLGSLDFGNSKSARISEFKRQFGGEILLSPMAEWCARPLAVSAVQLAQETVRRLRGR